MHTKFIYQFELIADTIDQELFWLDFFDFEEVYVSISQSEIRAGELRNIAHSALIEALCARVDYGDTVPKPSSKNGHDREVYSISLSPLTCIKLTLHMYIQKEGISKALLSRKLGTTQTDVARMLNLSHETRSSVLMFALNKLGLHVETTVKIVKSRGDNML